VLEHLTHAAQSLQAAHELAQVAGAEDAAAIVRRASVLTAGAISAVISPLEQPRQTEAA
jgi:hypothetical protein